MQLVSNSVNPLAFLVRVQIKEAAKNIATAVSRVLQWLMLDTSRIIACPTVLS